MTRYKKKAIAIEANQWFKDGDHPEVKKCDRATYCSLKDIPENVGIRGFPWLEMGVIETLEGLHLVSPGDFIITGIKGEHYPCKPDIFAELYEEAIPNKKISIDGTAEVGEFSTAYNLSDEEGNPAGGINTGMGYTIAWQHCPLSESSERNGAFVEDIIKAAIDRLKFFEASEFANDYNKRAIASLKIALAELDARMSNREARGVEGKYIV